MDALPDLDRQTPAEKNDLIRGLFAQVAALTAQIRELEGRLALSSRNSSKPPSTDGLSKPKPKSLRPAGQHPTGGQKGHLGHTLKKVAAPDYVETHRPPTHCEACHQPLEGIVSVVETRQVFDIPPLHYEVTEHQVAAIACRCGNICRGPFPEGVSAPVQYGPRVKAAAVHLTSHHMMPIARTGALIGDFFGLPMSDGTVWAANEEAQILLQKPVAAIGRALQGVSVAHADETGARVAGQLHWLHVLATATLTWIGCHPNRGQKAFEAFGLLTGFLGTLIHDGWKPYRELRCKHGLCNAHHLRELTYLFEEMSQVWAKRLIDLLTETCHEVHAATGTLSPERRAHILGLYAEILGEGEAANPRAPPSGRRGRSKQSKATNLLARLRLYADDVWRFMTDPGIPFTNNIAEQAVRMPKVKQKISGCFRTLKGVETFCVIRSYLATLHKQGDNLFLALTLTFQGKPPQPRFD